jgi:cob(I)alamin adenosyltransferase
MTINTSSDLNPDIEAERLNTEATSPSLTEEQYQRKMQRRKEVQEAASL